MWTVLVPQGCKAVYLGTHSTAMTLAGTRQIATTTGHTGVAHSTPMVANHIRYTNMAAANALSMAGIFPRRFIQILHRLSPGGFRIWVTLDCMAPPVQLGIKCRKAPGLPIVHLARIGALLCTTGVSSTGAMSQNPALRSCHREFSEKQIPRYTTVTPRVWTHLTATVSHMILVAHLTRWTWTGQLQLIAQMDGQA